MVDFCAEIIPLVKEKLTGLPSFCRLVMYELLTYCDYPSGTITIQTLDELAQNDFFIEPAPGRKKENVNANTLRNALRTIKKAKPEAFMFTVKRQRIVIDMPFLRDWYQKRFLPQTPDVAAVDGTDQVTPTTHSLPGQTACLTGDIGAEDAGDVAAAPFFSDIYNNNNNKKQTLDENPGVKKLISKNFYPTPETITRAQAAGHHHAADVTTIQAFIDYNQARGTMFADFNPVYLLFLDKQAERQQQQQLARLHTVAAVKKPLPVLAPISTDFRPSSATLERAHQQGYRQAADDSTIQAFIDYNQAIGSVRADFNPLYLRFLAQERQHASQNQVRNTHQQPAKRSYPNERSIPKNNSFEHIMASIQRDNPNPCPPSDLYPSTPIIPADLSHSATYPMALDPAGDYLRLLVCHEARQQ